MSCCNTTSYQESVHQTIYSDLMTTIETALLPAEENKALKIFEAFIEYISKNEWRYTNQTPPSSMEAILATPLCTKAPVVNCLWLANMLISLLATHGISDAKLYQYIPYGNSLSLKPPGRHYPGIKPSVKCFDRQTNDHLKQAYELKVSRHWVVTLNQPKLYLDPTFCCYYTQRDAILQPETSDR